MTWDWLRKENKREIRQIEDVWAMEEAREAKRERSKPTKKAPTRASFSEASKREARIAAKKQEAEIERAHERIQKTVQRPDPEPIKNRRPQDAAHKAKTLGFSTQTLSYLQENPAFFREFLATLGSLSAVVKERINRQLRAHPGRFIAFNKGSGNAVYVCETKERMMVCLNEFRRVIVERTGDPRQAENLLVLYAPKDSSEVP